MTSIAAVHRGVWRAVAVASLFGGGCAGRSAAPEPPAAPTVVVRDAPDAAQPETVACRDWSSLDLEKLEPIPKSPWSGTLEHVWRILLEKHYDPTLACLDWPALRQQYARALVEAKTDAEAYEILNQLLGELKQSHLAIVPPLTRVSSEPRTATTGGSGTPPLKARLIDGKIIVTDAAVDGIRSGVPAGAELLSIDGHLLAPIIEQHRALWKRDVEVSFHVARAVMDWLACDPGTKREVSFVPHGKNEPSTTRVACHERDVARTSLGHLHDVPIEVEHRMLGRADAAPADSSIGYLAFNIWMMPLVPQIEAAIAELRAAGMKALVLDLRGNPGGVGLMVVPLARQLLAESGSLGVMRMRGMQQHFRVTAGEDPFKGPVAILIDEGTASTSEIFAQGLRDLGRAQVIGSSTSQGAALPSLVVELPGGGLLQYVVADYLSPKGVAIEGRGVTPDILVDESAADFANGRDPVLAAAITALSQPH